VILGWVALFLIAVALIVGVVVVDVAVAANAFIVVAEFIL
jgi:hypothetical protein